MIVDHPLTRTGVRSLGIIIAGVVPLASSCLCYMLAYKESPFDTLLNEIPLVLHLLQANASMLPDSLTYGTPYLTRTDPLPGGSSPLHLPAPHLLQLFPQRPSTQLQGLCLRHARPCPLSPEPLSLSSTTSTTAATGTPICSPFNHSNSTWIQSWLLFHLIGY